MATSLRHIDNSMQKFQDVFKIVERGIENTKSVAEDCQETEEGKENVNLLRDIMLDYARMEREIKQCCQAVTDAKLQYQKKCREPLESADLTLEEDLLSVYKENLSKIQNRNTEEELGHHKAVLDFTQTVWTLHHGADSQPTEGTENIDDEIQMTQMDDANKFICPITKAEFVDPVKSVLCGHTYSRRAIETHIKHMKEKAKCPVAGCINFITTKDLQANNIIAFELRRKLCK